MASHRAEELRAAARVLGKAAGEVGFDPHSTVLVESDLDIDLEEFEEHDEREDREPTEAAPGGLFDYERIARAA